MEDLLPVYTGSLDALGMTSARLSGIQVEVQIEHVYARLTQQSQLPLLGVLANQISDCIFGQASFFGDARHLKVGGCRSDVRIESGR